MSTGLMQGKRGLIMGLANDKSIAWGIAQALAAQGAEIAFSYQGEALKKRVEPLAKELDALFAHLQKLWGKIDFLVHAIGFSDKNELRGRYVDTSRANFLMTMDISVYSFTAVCQRAAAIMPEGGSLLTLTYYGAEKVMPHYNVMGVAKAGLEASVKYLAEDLGKDGIRVNSVHPGLIETPIWITVQNALTPGTNSMPDLDAMSAMSVPLGVKGLPEDIANGVLWLCSSESRYVTGQELVIDGGLTVR